MSQMARRMAPASVGVAPFIAFPAVMMNATHGQNAFLTCALMGAGIMCLTSRPVVAGVLFGALAFKPQIGILIPVLLIAGGHWRAFGAASVTVVALCAASLAIFGAGTWSAYIAALPEARRVLEDGVFGHEKFQSVFAMLRIAGASAAASYATQSVVAITVAGLLAYVAHRSRDALACGALLCAGAALVTPFILRYDLMLLAIPLMWLARDAQRTPLRWPEAMTASCAFLLPLAPLDFTDATGVLIAPLVIAALFVAVMRRVMDGANEKGEPEGSPDRSQIAFDHSMMDATTPAPTVRPPSRMAKRSFSSMAIGTIRATSIVTLSPGITISVPSGSDTMPVTSVVRK